MQSITNTTIFDHLQTVQNERFVNGGASDFSVFNSDELVDNASVHADAVKWGKSSLGRYDKNKQIAESGNDNRIRKELAALWSKRSKILSATMFSTFDRNKLRGALNEAEREKEKYDFMRSSRYKSMLDNPKPSYGDLSPPPSDAEVRKNNDDIAKAKRALESFDKRVDEAIKTARDFAQKIRKLKEGASPEVKLELDKTYPDSSQSASGNFILQF
jgi:hypothetical protein